MMQTSTHSSLKTKNKSDKKQDQDVRDLDMDFFPSDSTIANILNYSSSLKVHASKSVGFIEIVAS